nr:lipase maturation factor family protein [Candidatus Microthrix sp.]
MEWWSAPGDALARLAFSRALAGVYLLAFLAALRQFRPLLRRRGLMPIPRYTASSPFARSPSVFHVRYSDRFFAACCWVGMALAGLAVVGVVDRAPLWGWMIIWAVLWALQLSILNVGQRWYSFGWETLLAEAGFLAIFLGPADVAPPLLIMWALRWLLFRGVRRPPGEDARRPMLPDLTCLDYHHETQPMPNPFS